MTNPVEVLDEDALLEEHPDIRAQLNELETEIEADPGKEVDKMSDKEMLKQLEEINEASLSYLKEKVKNGENRKVRKRAKLQLEIYKDLQDHMEEVAELIDQEKSKKAQKLSLKFMKKTMKKMKKAGLDDEQVAQAAIQLEELIDIQAQIYEETIGSTHFFWEAASAGLELIPFVSGPKMMVEAVIGKTMDGRKLSLPGKIWHMNWAGAWLLVDLAAAGVGGLTAVETLGLGLVGAEGAAFALKGKKIVKFSAAMMKGSKAAKKGGKASKAMLKTGTWCLENPKLAKYSAKVAVRGGQLEKAKNIRSGVNVAKTSLRALKGRRVMLSQMQIERMEFLSTLDQVFAAAA